MSYNFDYDYFDEREEGYDGFPEDDYDYEFSDELFYDENRYIDEFGDYEY